MCGLQPVAGEAGEALAVCYSGGAGSSTFDIPGSGPGEKICIYSKEGEEETRSVLVLIAQK